MGGISPKGSLPNLIHCLQLSIMSWAHIVATTKAWYNSAVVLMGRQAPLGTVVLPDRNYWPCPIDRFHHIRKHHTETIATTQIFQCYIFFCKNFYAISSPSFHCSPFSFLLWNFHYKSYGCRLYRHIRSVLSAEQETHNNTKCSSKWVEAIW